MKQYLLLFLITVFSIFIGSQITEGMLLVPHWQTLTSTDFYAHYNEFGPLINGFYTVLTIIAALIPIVVSIYCKVLHSNALKPALISSFLAILFISCFYIYFKDTNQLFYQASLSEVELKKELVTWSYWHWGRVFVECISLVFLIIAVVKIQKSNGN